MKAKLKAIVLHDDTNYVRNLTSLRNAEKIVDLAGKHDHFKFSEIID